MSTATVATSHGARADYLESLEARLRAVRRIADCRSRDELLGVWTRELAELFPGARCGTFLFEDGSERLGAACFRPSDAGPVVEAELRRLEAAGLVQSVLGRGEPAVADRADGDGLVVLCPLLGLGRRVGVSLAASDRREEPSPIKRRLLAAVAAAFAPALLAGEAGGGEGPAGGTADALERAVAELQLANEELRAREAERRAVVEGATAELSLHVATLKTAVELLEGRLAEGVAGDSRELAGIALRTVERLARLVAGLARLEGPGADEGDPSPEEPFDAVALVYEAVRTLRPLGRACGVELSVVAPASAVAEGDEEAAARLVELVVEEAIRRGGSSRAHVRVDAEGDAVRVVVEAASRRGSEAAAEVVRPKAPADGTSVLRAIARRAGARIDVAGGRDGGARWVVSLPRGGEKR